MCLLLVLEEAVEESSCFCLREVVVGEARVAHFEDLSSVDSEARWAGAVELRMMEEAGVRLLVKLFRMRFELLVRRESGRWFVVVEAAREESLCQSDRIDRDRIRRHPEHLKPFVGWVAAEVLGRRELKEEVAKRALVVVLLHFQVMGEAEALIEVQDLTTAEVEVERALLGLW